MTRAEVMVRMGELAVSADPSEVLVSLALGSCVGVAMVDRRRTLAGLAHVMLPESPNAAHPPGGAGGAGSEAGRFADTAVPELLERLMGLGALRPRIEVSLVGGAQMFAFGSETSAVGPRNEAAVREALAAVRLPVLAACTGGKQGRTIRVDVETGEVAYKAAGGPLTPLGRTP